MIDVKNIPNLPGCYLFKDASKKVLYVGKAKDLKKRVSNYLRKNLDSKTKALMKSAKSVDVIVTDSEVEALILENNLIKKNNPKYNIDLKDSKRYAYIHLTDEEYPRLLIARRARGKGEFFGPFVSAATRDFVLTTLIKTFQIRTCRKLPKRACLRAHINLCSAPCVLPQKEEYMKKIGVVKRILKGETKELVKDLKKEMQVASKNQKYERALMLRNHMQAIEWLSEKQKMQRQKRYNEDIINFLIHEKKVYLMLFHINRGVLEEKQEFVFDESEGFLEEFLVQYYSDELVPKELIVPKKVDKALEEFLTKKRGSKVFLNVPQKGEKKQLLSLVKKNIEIQFFSDQSALLDLQKKLRLQDLPLVVECFDISHLAGTFTVGSMVQFRNGKPDKNNYRRFKIKTVEGIDDFAGIAEVVKRRYTRLVNEKQPLPNLIVIDGGKGQLHAALDELSKLNIKIPIIGLAKKFEDVFVPGLSRPLPVEKKSKALKLLQTIRDEAHRFAITYNRLLRKKQIK